MAQQTRECNVVRVLTCVGEVLKTINWTHPTLDFFTNGALVDYDVDPTFVANDRIKEYDRLGVVLSVLPGNVTEEEKRTGGVQRQKYVYAIAGMTTLNADDKADGITLIQKQERIVNDCRKVLDSEFYLKQIAVATYANDLPVGQYVSCINHKITAVASDQGLAYPTINFDLICQFMYDELVPPMKPGSP